MFGKDKEEKKKSGGEVAGFIGKGMSIEGSLSFEETVRIDGSFKGDSDFGQVDLPVRGLKKLEFK